MKSVLAAKYKYGFIPILWLFLIMVSCEKETPTNLETNRDQQMVPQESAHRAAAKQLYEDYYVPSVSRTDETPWTGDEPSCIPGEVPLETKERILMRLAYYRRAVGLSNKIIENATKSERAQAAALMMFANQSFDHSPPDTWKCYSEDGRKGAANSLLTLRNNAEAIDAYIQDQGDDNGPVGHRRWLLWPELQEIGIGNTQQTNALWVLGNPGPRPNDAPEFVAWPPSGYLPKQLATERWSFSMAEADFSKTRIVMMDTRGRSLRIRLEPLDDTYGYPTVVWIPNGINLTDDTDDAFTVILQNVIIDGAMSDFEYTVTLFDTDQ